MPRARFTLRKLCAALVVLVYLCSLLSCSQREDEPVALETLPYLKHTHHKELRAELSRLIAEKATPQLLAEAVSRGKTVTERAEKLIQNLNKICPLQNVRLALESIKLCYPPHAFQFDPMMLEKSRNVLQRRAPQLEAYRRAFIRPDFEFQVTLNNGLLADLSVLDHASLAHRLEALYAADALAGGEPAVALAALRNMFIIDTRLAAVPNVAARSTAAQLRTEAFAVASAIVQHPRYTATLHKRLLKALQTQVEDWTSDRVTWVGDRALGIHAYELVRDGQLMCILTEQEIQKLKEKGNLDAFDKAVLKSVDDDQWFYLSAMRRVIDACDKPYFERLALFDQISQDVTDLANTPRSPLLAAHVLLPNLATVQRAIAVDRAYCEAWVLASRAAAGLEVDPTGPNPVTGEPYALERKDDLIIVKHLTGETDENATIMIPMQSP